MGKAGAHKLPEEGDQTRKVSRSVQNGQSYRLGLHGLAMRPERGPGGSWVKGALAPAPIRLT